MIYLVNNAPILVNNPYNCVQVCFVCSILLYLVIEVHVLAKKYLLSTAK